MVGPPRAARPRQGPPDGDQLQPPARTPTGTTTPTSGSPRPAATSWYALRGRPSPRAARRRRADPGVDRLAAPHHEGYAIETFVGAVPDDLVESLCVLLGQLAVDARAAASTSKRRSSPRSGMPRWSHHGRDGPGPVRDGRADARPSGGGAVHLRAVAGGEHHVYQWGTFVHREHRGHKLGLATKAVNLRAVQAARGDLTLVTTQNAETNDYMVSINERMGFRPIEVGRVRQAVRRSRSLGLAGAGDQRDLVRSSGRRGGLRRGLAALA